MELIDERYLGKPLRLEANMAGWQALFLDNQLVCNGLHNQHNPALMVILMLR